MSKRKLFAIIPIVGFLVLIVGVLVLTGTLFVTAADSPFEVRLQDQCNPPTFNAAVGPGTCIGDGTITFNHFIAILTNAHQVGAWHYDPSAGTVESGTVLQLENRGGETHTFTKVANFGGGFIAPLNTLSGNPVPAKECAIVTAGGLFPKPPGPGNIFVEAGETEAGPTAGSPIFPSGTTTKFQCCIHPWMRTELTAK